MFSAAELERARRIAGITESQDALSIEADISKDLSGKLHSVLIKAKVSKQELRAIKTRLCTYIIAALAMTFITRFWWAPLLTVIGATFEYMRIRSRAYKRAEGFERDYTAFLLSLASAVRTGLDPLVAMNESVKLFDQKSEISGELKQFSAHIDSGASEEEAVQAFGASIEHPDIPLFRTALLLSRKEGSSLAVCLQRLARVTRQRQSFRRKVKGAVAMQKLSSLGIAGCAAAIAVIQFLMNPQAMTQALEHPLGVKLMAGGLCMVGLGVVWMLRLTRAKI
ncbi:MAG: hypothetical protein DCC75_00045 [Proteobacteria bacterium]|nr:MAG: hypothetical protein DCC75_00045 [Pseudomonadota bacterium]